MTRYHLLMTWTLTLVSCTRRYLLNSTDRAELVSNLKGFYAKMGGKL